MENTLSLVHHPDSSPSLVTALDVSVERRAGGGLWLRYYVDGPDGAVVLPHSDITGRANNLWQTTCFEAFVRRAGDKGYIELNAAPSQQWAAYHFDGYREGMAELSLIRAPKIGCDASATHFALEVDVTLPETWAEAVWEIGISAVIEETDGTKSYWALTHPSGAPDFHHPDCFTLQLEAPESA